MKTIKICLVVGALMTALGFEANTEPDRGLARVDTLLTNRVWAENSKQLALLKLNPRLLPVSVGATRDLRKKDAEVFYLYGTPGDPGRFRGARFEDLLKAIAEHREKVAVRYAIPDFGGAANLTGRQLVLVKAVCDATGKIFVMQPGG